MSSLISKIIYSNDDPSFDGYDAAKYCLQVESAIREKWQSKQKLQFYLKLATIGIASYFLPDLVSTDELEHRITLLRNASRKIEQTAITIQRIAARTLYAKQKQVKTEVQSLQAPQFNSAFKTAATVAALWIKEGPSLSGYRGQVIWDKTKSLYKMLHNKGFYVFLHAHSYPITLHHQLASDFQSMHQSKEFKDLKPEESRTRFRAPGVAQQFKNTTDYLQSSLAKSINSGWQMDDHHRETIISCDAIPDNNEAYESTQHFFHSNRSIVDTATSTGKTTQEFDLSFIKSFIHNPSLQNYAASLFTQARKDLEGVADYGMVRVIAIAKHTIEDAKTNYVWRSHAFGRLCRCRHTEKIYGHNEFVETLKRHQEGHFKKCTVNGKQVVPQYRILAANLDKDPRKMIFNMDCLNSKERKDYSKIYARLQQPLINLIRLEMLAECRSKEEAKKIVSAIDQNEQHPSYIKGVQDLLKTHKALLDEN